jgi:hypothetical protein
LNGPIAAEKMFNAILDQIEMVPGYDAALIDAVRIEISQWDSVHAGQLAAATREVARLQSESDKLLAAIKLGDPPQRLVDDLRESERQLRSALAAKKSIEAEQPPVCDLPPIDELKRTAREALRNAQVYPAELSAILRKLIPEIRVFPVRLCDGGKITLRAKFVLSLVPLLSANQQTEAVERCLSVEMQVDLFDHPQRERFRVQVVQMREARLTESVIAPALKITKTVVQQAAALNRLMIKLGLSDPYINVVNPPDDYGKLRRHRHQRFKFQRLDDAA